MASKTGLFARLCWPCSVLLLLNVICGCLAVEAGGRGSTSWVLERFVAEEQAQDLGFPREREGRPSEAGKPPVSTFIKK